MVPDFHEPVSATYDAYRYRISHWSFAMAGVALLPPSVGGDSRDAFVLGHKSRPLRCHMDRSFGNYGGYEYQDRKHSASSIAPRAQVGLSPPDRGPVVFIK